MPEEPTKKEIRKGKSLEEHLFERELVDFDILTLNVMNDQRPEGRAEITLNEEVLAKVASLWENHKDAITAVISARIKPLLIKSALTDIPQEVPVTRQSIVELIGVLRDFEVLHKENTTRTQLKKETAQEGI